MSSLTDVKNILINVLQLDERSTHLTENSVLLGALTELDSITVAGVIMEIEEHFGIRFEHDEINGRVFATLGSLVSLVDRKRSDITP
jgi:acyl carrier protein